MMTVHEWAIQKVAMVAFVATLEAAAHALPPFERYDFWRDLYEEFNE